MTEFSNEPVNELVKENFPPVGYSLSPNQKITQLSASLDVIPKLFLSILFSLIPNCQRRKETFWPKRRTKNNFQKCKT